MNIQKLKYPDLVLASQSPSRKQQLQDLGFVFTIQPSGIDENIYKNTDSSMPDICQKIAKAKVQKVAKDFPSTTCILGGDQMVVLGKKIFNKSTSTKQAVQNLTQLQGNTHLLLTSLHITYKEQSFSYLEISKMHMRKLSQEQITKYVYLAKPLHCAGSYALERYGVALFQKIETTDQTAIIGFPIITLINQLLRWGISTPMF